MFLQTNPTTTAALRVLCDSNAKATKRKQVFDDFYKKEYTQSLKITQIHLRKEGKYDEYDTESLVQNAWVALYHKILDGEQIENAPGLLCEIIKKNIWNAWRKTTRRKAVLSSLFDEAFIKTLLHDQANETEAYANLLYKIKLLPNKCCNMFEYLTNGDTITEMYDKLVIERQQNNPAEVAMPENVEKWRKTMYVQLSNCRSMLAKLL